MPSWPARTKKGFRHHGTARENGIRGTLPGRSRLPGNPQGDRRPPSVLYVRGSLEELQPAVAIVGMRSPSLYGKDTAFRLARNLSSQGISIISGLARGIDAEAHRGALDGIAGTVAVLGSGIDVIYPPEHRDLAERVSARGAVVSEFPGYQARCEKLPPEESDHIRARPGRGRRGGDAQVRSHDNGPVRTGSGQAHHGGAGQRHQCAVPGPPPSPETGALLVEHAGDIIAEIAPQLRGIVRQFDHAEAQPDDILAMASGSPVSIDEIAMHLDIDVTEACRRVSTLELSGSLKRTAGNRYTTRSIHG